MLPACFGLLAGQFAAGGQWYYEAVISFEPDPPHRD